MLVVRGHQERNLKGRSSSMDTKMVVASIDQGHLTCPHRGEGRDPQLQETRRAWSSMSPQKKCFFFNLSPLETMAMSSRAAKFKN
jgi:hypothetical protein